MKADATSTENTLPKFELAVILMYLSMLAKVRRPSSTPSSSTIRLFSSRMISAASLAISTAVSTEMPMSAVRSAGASLMPSPMKPTTWPLPFKNRTMRSLCDGRQSGEHVVRFHCLGQCRVIHALDIVAQQHALLLEPHFAANLGRDQFVVAGQHLHRHAMLGQRLERRGGRSPWADRGRRRSRSASARARRPRHRRPSSAAIPWPRPPPRAGLLRSGRRLRRECAPAAPASADSTDSPWRTVVQTDRISSTAPLQISSWWSSRSRHHHRHAAAGEVEGDFVDLAVVAGRIRAPDVHRTCSSTATSSRFFRPVW